MAKKNFYAVKNGRNGDGIYQSWEECRASTVGVPGVRFQGFATREEAEAFLELTVPAGKKPAGKKAETEKPEPPMPFREGTAVAYVDGSYRADTREFSCGAVLFWQGEKMEFSRKNDDPEMAEMRNVAGEIMGAVVVIRWCLAHEVPALEIYHDYAGVGRWGMGQWKTNRQGTRAYAAFCAKAREQLKLSFVEVRGHSGDYWNDEADRLAKEALGI